MWNLRTTVFCPCSEKVPLVVRSDTDLELSMFPTTITDSHTRHPLSFLNFCEQCQAVKCRKCVELEVVTKYCPRCMHEMKPEHSFCSRSCFDCPLCASNCHVSQRTVQDSENTQRLFHFRCTMCPFTYDTQTSEKPRSLARMVKNEVNRLPPIERFSDLEKYYIQSKQIQEGQIDFPRAIIKQCAEMKIKDSDIPEFIRRSTIHKFDTTSDINKVNARSQDTSSVNTINYDVALQHTVPEFQKSSALYPLSTQLRAKHSKRCKACRTSLMKPDADPSSVKFYKLSNAIDTLPTTTIRNHPTRSSTQTTGATIDYILIFKNPLDVEMTLTLSSTPFTSKSTTAHLPVTSITLGRRPENSTKLETIVKSTPSIELTKETKLGRIELMSRVPVNYEQNGVLERAANFAVVPMKVTIGADLIKGDDVRVPLLVSMRGDGVACGYWVVAELGVVE